MTLKSPKAFNHVSTLSMYFIPFYIDPAKKNRLGYTIRRCGSYSARECASYIIDRHCTQQRTWERSSFTAFRKDLAAPIYSLYYEVDEAEFRDLREKKLHEGDASRFRAVMQQI